MTPTPAFQIEVQIDQQLARQVDESALRAAVAATLRDQNVTSDAALTLVITDDETIRRLNRQFRQIDAPTDVLAFPAFDESPFVAPPDQPTYLGDVIVSQPRAAAQAATAGHSLSAELALLAVHGTLHLLGHDHTTPQEKALMWRAQETILTALGHSPNLNP
jgi:probable rRNA maturation factor